MNNIEDLVIDNYPRINTEKMTISTEFCINSEEDISISINNTTILSNEDIYEITNNVIELVSGVEIKEDDSVAVIYNKI